MIIAVANTKGGTGKTTTAVQLALYRQSLGHEVWLVDGDEQQSALTAVSIRSENNVTGLSLFGLFGCAYTQVPN